MRLHRLVAILLLVESRGQIKAKELAAALETSVRTIYRDVDTLCEAGIPLAATTGPNGGIRFMEGYSVNMKSLHGDDVINLYLSGIGIHPDGQSDTGVKLKNALLKLEKSLPAEYRADIQRAKERFYFDETPWWGELPKIPWMDSLRKSVWQSRALKISYRKMSSEVSERTLHPYGLVVKAMEWYLVAYCVQSRAVRTFKCERIEYAEILNEQFAIPGDFSLEEYWRQSAQNFFASRREEEQYPVGIRLPGYRSYILKNLEVYELQEQDGYITATVNMHKYDFACDDVLDIVGHAEILWPAELREYVKRMLEEMVAVYSEQ